MRRNFLTHTRVWSGGMVLLVLAVVVPAAPALALPIGHELSGFLTGTFFRAGNNPLYFDTASPVAFASWNVSDGFHSWNNVSDLSTILNTAISSTDAFLTTFNHDDIKLTLEVNLLNVYCETLGGCYLAIVSPSGGRVPSGVGDITYITGTPVPGTPVPEASSILLLATGLLGLAGARWWQVRQKRMQVG